MGSTEKLQVGVVISNKMDKTVVVRIDRMKRHRLYGKNVRRAQRYKVHDETNECRLGDIVGISETRPLSREKRWRVVEVITKGDVAEIAPREIGAHIVEETRAAADAEAAARREEESARHAARVEAEAAAEAEAEASTDADSSDEAAPEAAPADEAGREEKES
jgi:small subunit ribosomal protein S17